jgi:hypothetical protein
MLLGGFCTRSMNNTAQPNGTPKTRACRDNNSSGAQSAAAVSVTSTQAQTIAMSKAAANGGVGLGEDGAVGR